MPKKSSGPVFIKLNNPFAGVPMHVLRQEFVKVGKAYETIR